MKACIEVSKQWMDADEKSIDNIEAEGFFRLSPGQKIKVLDSLRVVRRRLKSISLLSWLFRSRPCLNTRL